MSIGTHHGIHNHPCEDRRGSEGWERWGYKQDVEGLKEEGEEVRGQGSVDAVHSGTSLVPPRPSTWFGGPIRRSMGMLGVVARNLQGESTLRLPRFEHGQ